MRLEILDQELAVCRLDVDSPVPSWLAGELTAVVRRYGECSLVCAADAVPDDGVEHAGPYRALMIVGQVDLAEVGVLRDLTVPLAAAEVPVFALSTYDTDLLLVPAAQVQDAVTALAGAGYEVTGS